jgi:5-methylcytosine-specific restriction endonuclease McrA
VAIEHSSARPIVTRKQAKALGLVRYFPGSTCKHGHVTERLTSNGSCLECCRLNTVAKYQANPAADLAKQKRYREEHPERAAVRKARKYAADPALAERMSLRRSDLAKRAESKESGASMYDSPRECVKCKTCRRFSADGKCVECNRVYCNRQNAERLGLDPMRARRTAEKKAEAKARREKKEMVSAAASTIRHARQTAIARGDKTYIGKQCPQGHAGIRYTKHGGCVTCAAAHSASAEKKLYDAEYLKKNADRIRARMREYRAANPEYNKQKAKEWAAKNPERRRSIAQSYKHRRRAQEQAGISGPELNAWKKAARKVCYWCGKKCAKGYCVDHYEPLSKGGKHEISNLVIACRPCNARKSAKDPEQFRAETWHGTLFSHLITPCPTPSLPQSESPTSASPSIST